MGLSLATKPKPASQSFMVIRKSGGDWDGGATIIDGFPSEASAETRALELQRQFPAQSFGVFGLESFTESELTSKLTRTEG